MSPVVLHRKYRAGMAVIFRDQRWEIDAVEFWVKDDKLKLSAPVESDRKVKTCEAWAHEVLFTGEFFNGASREVLA